MALLNKNEFSFPELYLHFVQNYMHKIRYSISVKILESNGIAVKKCVYNIISNLRTDLERRKGDNFFGFIVRQALPSFTITQQLKFKKNAIEVFKSSLDYLNKWIPFQDIPLRIFKVLNLQIEEDLFGNFIKIFQNLKWNFNGDEL